MDIKTILILIIIINVLIFIFLYGLIKTSIVKNSILKVFVLSKAFFMLGWAFLLLRSIIPYTVSVLAANVFILIAFGIEMFALTTCDKKKFKRQTKLYFYVGLVLVIGFISIFKTNEFYRIAYMSASVFIWHIIASYQFITKKEEKNKLKITIGILYLIFGIIALMRVYGALFLYDSQTLYDTNFIQSITFTSIFISNFIGVIVLLLFLKEQDEKKIGISEAKFEDFTNSLPQTVFEVNATGKIVYLNEYAFKYTSFKPSDITKGLNIKDIIAKKDNDTIFSNLKTIMTGSKATGNEYLFQKKTGEKFPGIIYSYPLIKDDKPVGLRGIIVDISDIKKREQENRQLSIAVEQSSNTIVITNTDGCIEYANPKFEKLTGYTCKEALGENPRILNAGTQPKEYYEELWKTITAGKTWKGEFHNKKKNGEYFWENVTITPIKNDKGKIINYLAIKEDITARKIAEEKLKDSEDKFRSIVETASDWIWEIDKDGKYTYSSPKVFSILGYTIDEIIGKTPFDLMSKKESKRVSETFAEIVKQEQHIIDIENTNIHKNGSIVVLETTGVPFFDSDNKLLGYRGIDRDITKRKIIEREIVKQNDKLKDLVATKDKFFSIIAHDLRSPLGTMAGFTKLLVESFDEYDIDKQKELIKVLYDTTDKTYKLVENLLLWSRTQQSDLSFNPQNENLFLIAEETTDLLIQAAKRKYITIKNKITHNLFVSADKDMVLTVFRNLISNAIKFTNQGGEITITANKSKDKTNNNIIEITITDTGVGITKDVQKKLFKISENYSSKGTDNETGTGLGLILCKEFISKHNGNITIESEIGKGSKFIFTLPV